ncbi:hypothetical protein D3C78_1618310 [compost metagenome]
MPRPLARATVMGLPVAWSRKGRSFSISCSCKLIVPVEMTTVLPAKMAGSR